MPLWGSADPVTAAAAASSTSSSSTAAAAAAALSSEPGSSLRLPDPSFPNSSLWAPGAAASVPGAPHVVSAFRTLGAAATSSSPTKQDTSAGHAALAQLIGHGTMPASAPSWLSQSLPAPTTTPSSTSEASSSQSDGPQAKRARVSESPERKARSISASMSTMSADDEEGERGRTQRRSASAGSRRAPPSASQVTEAGLPFPVIDTSVKHSSLFVPPDTSGLTKREARLVKNRAAAFLSRQRKREQFEELACKCRALARLSYMLWDALDHATASSSALPGLSSMDRVLEATSLHEQLAFDTDGLRSTLQQVVANKGGMIVEGIMGDDGPSKTRTHDITAQLAASQKECERLRAELDALRDSTSTTSPTTSSTSSLVQLVGDALMKAHQAPPESDAAELLSKDDGAMQMRMVVAPESEAVLCTLTPESHTERLSAASPAMAATAHDDEEKSWRCSTPVESSEASMPSLCSSASPSLSSLSSGSSGARRSHARRVVAYCAGVDRSTSLLGDVRPLYLDDWAAAHAEPLQQPTSVRSSRTEEVVQCATRALETLLTQNKMDVQQGCFLVASQGNEALKLALYAKPCAEETSSQHGAFLLPAVRDTLRALAEGE